MQPDGRYERLDVTGIVDPFSAHEYFMAHASLSGRGRAAAGAPVPFDHVGPRS
jgi:polyphosphate kinase